MRPTIGNSSLRFYLRQGGRNYINQTQENPLSPQDLGGQAAPCEGTDHPGHEKALFAWLGFHDVPAELWKYLHMTNILVKTCREKRRRTRPMKNSFTNAASPGRTIWRISPRLNTGWDGKPFNES